MSWFALNEYKLHETNEGWVKVWHLMPQSKCKIVHTTHTRTKCMNCIIAVVIAILALVIHVVSNYLEEKTIYPKFTQSCLPDVSW